MPRPIDTTDEPAEHHPACRSDGRCVRGCEASPLYAPISATHDGSEPRIEPRHHHAEGERAAPPLWETDDLEHMSYLRSVGLTPQLPETYHRYERSNAYNLDRYTAYDGEHSVKLETERLKQERRREAKILQTNEDHRAKVVATYIRDIFPAVSMLDEVTDAHNGFLAGCYAGIVWGMALWMFGLTHDPLPEHVSGRILRGEPVRDLRAPFRDVAAVLFQRNSGLLGTGGGVWPQDDNRPKARTIARWGEMKVSPTHSGTENARGEVSINRALSGDAAVRRAQLSDYEQRQAAVWLARGMTKKERLQTLREMAYEECGGNLRDLVTRETKHMRAMHDLKYVTDLAEHRQALDVAADDKAKADLSAAFAEMIAARLAEIEKRGPLDKEAYPRLLREATQDVRDRVLIEKAQAAVARLRTEVYRVSDEGDDLANKPQPSKRKPRAQALALEVFDA